MRFAIISAALAVSCAAANAGQRENCESVSTMASTIMDARQSGMPITDLLKITGSWGGGQSEVAESMAMQAYKRSLCASERCRKSIAAEFGNTWYLACMK